MDIPSALRSLDLSREDDVPDLGWLDESHCDPPAFWAALGEHARRVAPGPRSRAGVSVDLYHDAIGRHASTARVALAAYDRRSGWRALSYAELAAGASATAQGWANAGLGPGDVVALVLPLGAAWLIAFAAAIRLGLVVSFLAPAGERALVPRLDALAPARVVIDPDAPPPVGAWAEKAISIVEAGSPHAAPPHGYQPDEPCARLFSPVREPLLEPVDLAAEVAYQNALRDAVLAYRLSPGDALALPGFHPQQHHPAAILSTLIAGATFVHVDAADVLKKPELLKEQPITALGISPEIRDALRKKPLGRLPKLRHWLKTIDEPLDWTAYHDLVQKNEWEKILVSNVLADAAAGGCVLFSTRRPGSIQAISLPSAGRAFALADVASGEPAVGKTGVFVPMPDGDPAKDGWFLLAGRGSEYLYGLTLLPRRAGRVFPAAEVEALAAAQEGVEGACVVPVPTGDPGGRWAFVLVLFTGAISGQPASKLAAAVEQAIRDDLGDDFAPDRVTAVPLYPRKKKGAVDAGWCRQQYGTGLLSRKAAHPVFRALTALRGALLGG